MVALAGMGMDLEIRGNIAKIAEFLREMGFEVSIKRNKILEAKMREGRGRIHVLGIEINKSKVYLDVHWDSLIHIAFLGVDYAKKPREISKKILIQAAKNQMEGKIIGGMSWRTRKNKAIFRGIKI